MSSKEQNDKTNSKQYAKFKPKKN